MKMKKILFMSAALLLILASPMQAQLKIGDKAPDFKLRNVDNSWVALMITATKKEWSLFSAVTIVPTLNFMKSVIALQEEFGPRKFP